MVEFFAVDDGHEYECDKTFIWIFLSDDIIMEAARFGARIYECILSCVESGFPDRNVDHGLALELGADRLLDLCRQSRFILVLRYGDDAEYAVYSVYALA